MPAWYQQRDQLLPLLKKFSINCVLDVGAHTGEFARFMRSIGYTGKILSFEPVSQSYSRVSAMAAGDDAWTVHQVALGREDGEAEINVTDSTEFCSMLAPNQFCYQQFGDKAAVRRKERVPVRALDALLRRNYQDQYRQWRIFLKIDTQGRDLDVIEGGLQSLPQVQMLQTELSFQQIYHGMPAYADVLTRLQELRFRPAAFFPITRDADSRIIEMDCLLIADHASEKIPN